MFAGVLIQRRVHRHAVHGGPLPQSWLWLFNTVQIHIYIQVWVQALKTKQWLKEPLLKHSTFSFWYNSHLLEKHTVRNEADVCSPARCSLTSPCTCGPAREYKGEGRGGGGSQATQATREATHRNPKVPLRPSVIQCLQAMKLLTLQLRSLTGKLFLHIILIIVKFLGQIKRNFKETK